MLVLPPFQRLGLGAELLETIYGHFKNDTRVLDITGKKGLGKIVFTCLN